jgi:tetratricopeptide (TPR) repeat protein
MKYLLILNILFCQLHSLSQPNCNVYLWKGDTAQYNACLLLEKNIDKYYQFSKEFHQLVDSALSICPRFAYAYREKAAPYVKSGNFIEWKKYIDLAVKYDTLSYLPVRASLRYKFFADYEGAINDIELIRKISKHDVGYTSNGTYHFNVVKALCLKAIGNIDEAIKTLNLHMNSTNYASGVYDYLHLGVLYLEIGNDTLSEKYLTIQNQKYEFAETYYYLALCYKKQKKYDAYQVSVKRAKELLGSHKKLFDSYNSLFDQIYFSDLLKLR